MQGIVSILLIIFSLIYVPSMVVSYIYNDNMINNFTFAFFIVFILGAFFFKKDVVKTQINRKISAMLVCLLWFALSIFVTLPFLFSGMPFVDAFFEAVSGLTTTGATVISSLETWPKSLLFYRQFLQWFGGIGVILVVVAILPMFGGSSTHLYQMEITGIQKDQKLTPRITSTAKSLLFIYLLLTVLSCISYKVAGMSWFDAIGHSFSTVAIGGFSTHDASLGYFQNRSIEVIAVIFMLISSINFGLHFLFLYTGKIGYYLRDKELRWFCGIILFSFAVAGGLYYFGHTAQTGLWELIFQGTSVVTTTGFTSQPLNQYPAFFQWFWIILCCIGGCAGSVSGGMKVIRWLVVSKHITHEVKRFLHPNLLLMFKMGKGYVSQSAVNSVWGFFGLYILIIIFAFLLLLALGVGPETSISAVLASLNNLGPGLGDVAYTYQSLSSPVKLVLAFLMLLGRLEIIVIFSLLTIKSW